MCTWCDAIPKNVEQVILDILLEWKGVERMHLHSDEKQFHIFFDRSRMTRTVQSLHNCRWLKPFEAPHATDSRLHFNTRSPSGSESWFTRSRPILILQDTFSSSFQLTQLSKTSKHLCSTFGWSLLLHRSKLANSSATMAISLKNCRVEQNTHSFLANWLWLSAHVQFPAFAQTRDWFVCSSHPWFHCALWSAFGLPRITSFSHFASLYLLQSKIQHQKAFSPNTHALSLRHSLPQWVYGIVRVPRNLDCTLLSLKKSFALDQKDVSRQPKFSICMIRETVRWW